MSTRNIILIKRINVKIQNFPGSKIPIKLWLVVPTVVYHTLLQNNFLLCTTSYYYTQVSLLQVWPPLSPSEHPFNLCTSCPWHRPWSQSSFPLLHHRGSNWPQVRTHTLKLDLILYTLYRFCCSIVHVSSVCVAVGITSQVIESLHNSIDQEPSIFIIIIQLLTIWTLVSRSTMLLPFTSYFLSLNLLI